MGSDPTTFPPLDVQLDYIAVDSTNNNIYVRLRFDDGVEWMLEWGSDSSEGREIYEFFSRMATQTLARIGGRGVVVTGPTPIEEDDQ